MVSDVNELLASDSRLRVLLGCTKGIVFELDRDVRYLGAWTHDEALLARPSHELIGRTIDEVLGPTGHPFTQAVNRVFDSGRPEVLDYELMVQGGRRCFVADILLSPQIPGRDPTVVSLIRDVTEHKLLEERLKQAEKLESIGRLAAGVAHDYNNILTTIIGYSQMLVEGLQEDSLHLKHATKIRHAAARASALTAQLLTYGRQRKLAPEVVDLNAAITTLADTLRQLLGPAMELHLELAPDLGGGYVDRIGLDQILTNLVLNARDALGSTLKIRTEPAELDATRAELHDVPPGTYALLHADDDGVGMDEITKARVFEPFFTTKKLGKGTGLGLATVYEIVRQSRGHIELETTPGAGARFTIYLPCFTPDAGDLVTP